MSPRIFTLAVVAATLLPTSGRANGDGEGCPRADGRHAIIEAGREGDVLALFAPHRPGAPLEGAPGWSLGAIRVAQARIEATLDGPDGAEVVLLLRERSCDPTAQDATSSFVLSTASAPPPGAGPALAQVQAAIRRNDAGGFFRIWVGGPRLDPRADPRAPGTPGAAEAVPQRQPSPFPGNTTVLVVILAAALLGLLGALGPLAEALGVLPRQRGGWITLAALFAILAAALALRLAAGPTFIREAYAFPDAHWFMEGLPLGGALDAYPQGPHVLSGTLGHLLADDPYDAWFRTHLALGVASVAWVFAAVTLVTRRRAAGLVAAGLLATWPQHVRLSASESVHAAFVCFALAAFALALLAALDGRRRTFFAAVTASLAAAIMRPEAALLLPAVVLVALGHADGVRRRWASPGRWAVLAAAVWLYLPVVQVTLADPSAGTLGPSGDAGALGEVGRVVGLLVATDGTNGLFDLATTPLWLWPLGLFGLAVLWRDRHRAAAVGLGATLLGYLILYRHLEPAVTIWTMGRYHAAMLPAGAILAGVGAHRALTWATDRLGHPRLLLPVAVALAAGALAWWPAVTALPLDWQQDHHAAIAFGRDRPELSAAGVRIVTPDNRRRFLDLSPRQAASPLTGGRQDMRHAYTVEHLMRADDLDLGTAPVYYHEGLFCYLAVRGDERLEPQCAAMHRAFVLERVAAAEIVEGPYLLAYAKTRVPGPVTVAVYRVRSRRLGRDEALSLLPPPLEMGSGRDDPAPFGAGTPPFMDPPEVYLPRPDGGR